MAIKPKIDSSPLASDKWIALLGKRNLPLDGVEDYCTFLAAALRERGIDLQQQRVAWDVVGWDAALAKLAAKSADWRGRWVLLQYTALAWSERGFPFRALKVLNVLRRSGARVAVVFHEFTAQMGGHSAIQPVRAACQNFAIRRLHERAERSVFTVPLASMPWLQSSQTKAAFIPIGANIPEPAVESAAGASKLRTAPGDEKTVAVFCFSEDQNRYHEADDIAFALREAHARVKPLHLLLIGRGSDEMGPELRARLAGTGIRVSAKGALPSPELTALLSQAAVQLFVSGMVAQTRGTALVGIACGLPVVGYGGAAEGTTLAEAGLSLAPYRNREALAAALAQVLCDEKLRRDLGSQSRNAHMKYFSWRAIGERFFDVCQAQHQVMSLPIDAAEYCVKVADSSVK